MEDVTIKERLLSVFIYTLLLLSIQGYVVHTGLLPNENSLWLFNGLAGLIFGSRLLNPYFTPPLDAAMNAFAALASLIAASMAIIPYTHDAYVLGFAIGFFSLILIGALAVILARPLSGSGSGIMYVAAEKAIRQIGSPSVIFAVVTLVSVWLFHRTRPFEAFAILSAFSVIALLRPIESMFAYISWVRLRTNKKDATNVVGHVVAYQAPKIVLIRQLNDRHVPRGTTLAVGGEEGKWLLGIALNYVGRDEGNLLRVLTTELKGPLVGTAANLGCSPTAGLALSLTVPAEQAPEIPTLQWIGRLCGIVDSETTFEALKFEVIDERDLSEGRIVETRIGESRDVLFQLVEGITHEEVVQQKSKYGYARATARKIGRWDAEEGKFSQVSWLPQINSPVFLKEVERFVPRAETVGHFPGTNYGVDVNISHAVTHNTAILGILGVGKSFLALELVERMLAADIKVLCLDLTNQYANELEDFFDQNHEDAMSQLLRVAGANGRPNQNREIGGSKHALRAEVRSQLRQFMEEAHPHRLRIINPAQIEATKQASGWYNGSAELMTLTASEVTGIFSECALEVCQELGLTERARLCIIYEEAHSLVPEWNSVAAEGDRQATAVSSRAILQGRKYGLGCLLITQRTANVTKTILNQCNTIFAMRTFDDTGKEFLSNYIGHDFSKVLPSLEPRNAIYYGKASSCDNPVLIRLNDQQDFRAAFRAIFPLRPRLEQPHQQAIDAADNELDDDIPF